LLQYCKLPGSAFLLTNWEQREQQQRMTAEGPEPKIAKR
jgi:hypothetical protein